MVNAGGAGAQGPIAEVREGMRVVDADGEEVGSVELVKMGDPVAATSQGQDPGSDNTLMSNIASAFGRDNEPDLPASTAERLLRTGFVRIDSKGLFARDVYVSADGVARVEGETVHLTVPKGQLATRD